MFFSGRQVRQFILTWFSCGSENFISSIEAGLMATRKRLCSPPKRIFLLEILTEENSFSGRASSLIISKVCMSIWKTWRSKAETME